GTTRRKRTLAAGSQCPRAATRPAPVASALRDDQRHLGPRRQPRPCLRALREHHARGTRGLPLTHRPDLAVRSDDRRLRGGDPLALHRRHPALEGHMYRQACRAGTPRGVACAHRTTNVLTRVAPPECVRPGEGTHDRSAIPPPAVAERERRAAGPAPGRTDEALAHLRGPRDPRPYGIRWRYVAGSEDVQVPQPDPACGRRPREGPHAHVPRSARV